MAKNGIDDMIASTLGDDENLDELGTENEDISNPSFDDEDEQLDEFEDDADLGDKEEAQTTPPQGTAPAKDGTSQGTQNGEQGKKFKRVGNDLIDDKGNVVNEKGEILAKAGPDRRLYAETVRARSELEVARNENTQMRQQLEQAREFAELPQRLGISPDDYRDALNLARTFAQNPVQAAKEVVARAMALGHNVTDILGNDVGNSVDMIALRRMQEELHQRPLREQQQAQQAREEQMRNAQTEVNRFLAKYPDAETHGEAIANLMARGVNPETAYLQIQNFALANGLDFSQPLGPQIAARNEAAVQSQVRTRGSVPPAGRRAPMNGGRTRESNQSLTTDEQFANADASYGDIIRQVMGRK